MKKDWQENVFHNFDSAVPHYNNNAEIQKNIAWNLAKLCTEQSIPKGTWLDLGSGTGLLAEALESLNPNQSVIRIDSSQQMINSHNIRHQKQVWDLNQGLPYLNESPQLIASSFALHWLMNPSQRLSEWFKALDTGGWIALSLPIQGSFIEWYDAAKKADVPCTAMDLPSRECLLKTIKTENIKHNRLVRITQTASNLTSLFKPMIKVGAHTSSKPSLRIGEWRRLKKAWPKSKDQKVTLTWLIQLLLIER